MKNFLLPLLAAIGLPTAVGAVPPPPRRHRIIQKSQAIKKIVASTKTCRTIYLRVHIVHLSNWITWSPLQDSFEMLI